MSNWRVHGQGALLCSPGEGRASLSGISGSSGFLVPLGFGLVPSRRPQAESSREEGQKSPCWYVAPHAAFIDRPYTEQLRYVQLGCR